MFFEILLKDLLSAMMLEWHDDDSRRVVNGEMPWRHHLQSLYVTPPHFVLSLFVCHCNVFFWFFFFSYVKCCAVIVFLVFFGKLKIKKKKKILIDEMM